MEIRPFRGWRYVGRLDGDISPYVAPPYDVLSAEDKQHYLGEARDNIVAVDLPHVPPTGEGPEEVYRRAADRLAEWESSGVLRQDDPAALYVYEQAFEWAGRTYVRRAMLCGVRATELGRDVIPHEHVFPGPLADRLKLTECTRTQLSPIFGFYEDPAGRVGAVLAEIAAKRPVARAVLNEVVESLWLIDEPARIETVASALRDVPVFIADGHHRYTTALNYIQRLGGAGGLSDDHEANYVMFALVSRDDPGLLILPTHRMIRGLPEGFSVAELADEMGDFEWRRSGTADIGRAGIETLLGCSPPGAMVLIDGPEAQLWVASLQRPEAMAEAVPDATDEWRCLPPSILHELVIEKALKPRTAGELLVSYTPDVQKVVAACRSGEAQLGVILQSIPVGSVVAIASSGGSMPHKSTYFYPKVSTGMVLKPLE
ncbi:MAG TPA: DUF1015 domain-containing protein [Phycisphaerae bacterium]|nr:DUF1015 domain-containing protein [Phycisphaerae bacterium]